ncbi:MAG: RagB/SusD family nutrient uptake outer membrane protein [Mediterranea sp.]|jgi:hypothetical protein|nr:RagB/SusD family nutrient uptake outer membrane protein [Mediterranea sp.]
MKKIILPLLCVAMLFGACEDRLEVVQKGVISKDDFYKTDADAENALVNVYSSLAYNIYSNPEMQVYQPYRLVFNLCGDDMYQGGSDITDFPDAQALNYFSYGSQNKVIELAYGGLYGLIYDSNLVIDNIMPDSEVKTRVLAEARTLRAWAHLMLAIGWGTPPLVDQVLPSNAQPTNTPHDELLAWVAAEAEECASVLSERLDKTDKEGASKVTRGLAYTIAGKARLFMKDYAGAKENLKKVISSGKYDLVPTDRWANLFHSSGDLCEEMIFQINTVWDVNVGFGLIGRTPFQFDKHWNWAFRDRFASKPTNNGATEGWGAHAIRKDFAEKMLANEGDSPRRKATFYTPDEFFYEMLWDGGKERMPVFDADGKPVDDDKDGKQDMKPTGPRLDRAGLEVSPDIGLDDVRGLFCQDMYFAHKHIVWPEDMQMGIINLRNFTFYRYAEVLLMYAEACAMTNDPDGLQYLQKIQTRAGAPVASALTLDEVKKEKGFEMWLEEVRWADMVRWGDFSGVVDNGKSLPSTFDAFFTKGEEKHRLYVEYATDLNKGTVGFQQGKHEYLAFPYKSTSINPNIVQNPSGL